MATGKVTYRSTFVNHHDIICCDVHHYTRVTNTNRTHILLVIAPLSRAVKDGWQAILARRDSRISGK
jgi:hypothetical protein